jgi:trans-aconitate 2-methyltransferase
VSRRWDAATYDRVSDPLVRMADDVLARVTLLGDETVLDAGCGTGRVTERLLERIPDGRVIALDVSAPMLAEAAARLARFGDRVTLREADLGRPLTGIGPVDLVLSTATFHWVLDAGTLWANLAGALRSAGRLVAQCGGEGNCATVFGAMESLGERPMDRLRFDSPASAVKGLGRAGFTAMDAWLTPEPVTFPTTEAMEEYLATVVLGPLTDRPASELPALAHEVVARLPEPALDYVRLNLGATRAG